jgi:tRNA(adenine34) deaminase
VYSDNDWMEQALLLAQQAADAQEVPVGALVVQDNHCIGQGWNCPIGQCDPSAHAEIIALRAAAKTMANYRLPGATLYVTLEPCAMCAGAILQARLARVVFAATDPKAGAVLSRFQLLQQAGLNHRCAVDGGLLAEPALAMLQHFFQQRRKA